MTPRPNDRSPRQGLRALWRRRLTWWHRSRGWWLLITSALLGAAVGLVAKDWLAGWATAGSAALVGVVVAQVGTRGKTYVEARSARRHALASQVVISSESGGLRRVRDLPDAVSFRVHPAATVEDHDGRLSRVPPYVPRDIDVRLEKALTGTGFVLLVGESTAGKTRTAYEAVRRTLADHVFVAPKGRKEIEQIVATVLEHRKSVVWLDELDQFLGPDGLTVTTLNRILGDGSRHTVVVATIRTALYDRYSPREEAKADGSSRELLRQGRDALRMAHQFDLPRRWSDAEIRRARELREDPRIRKALEHVHEFGVGELLAAGPQLLADWRNAWTPGRHPRGAAIVAAAVDCRRAGLHGPVGEETLRRLHVHYLDDRDGGSGLRPESFDRALAWAVEPVPETTSSLLIPDDQGYRAFDYLIDTVDAPVHSRTWTTLLDDADPQDSYDIGLTAYQQKLYDHAEAGLGRAAAGGVAEAEEALARCIGDAGRPAEAARRFESLARHRADTLGPSAAPTLSARRQHAVYVGRESGSAVAVDLLTELIGDATGWLGEEHPETLIARYDHAVLVGSGGDLADSTQLLARLIRDCTRALGIDDTTTLKVRYQYANSLGAAGRYVRAAVLLENLIRHRTDVLDDADNPDVLLARHQHATFLGRAGRYREAVDLFTGVVRDRARVLGAGHLDTLLSRHQHATYLGQSGGTAEATKLFATLTTDYQAIYGKDHVETLAARYQHDVHLGASGHKAKAIRSLATLAIDCTRVLGMTHQITKMTQLALDYWRASAE
ncbi:hypothetical protein ACFYOT_40050 [Saccharothrix saharensis]|uniref:hypothetical protein n=1 Tax=Saccharothrix saharensis TaxID=571190 RepID=UPI0036D0149F